MNRSEVDALVNDLGRRLGLEGLCLDGSGCCQLAFDRCWLVTMVLHPAGDRLVMHCPIGPPGEIEPADLLAMLQGNFLGCAAWGGSLAIAPDRRACVQQEIALNQAGVGSNLIQKALERLLIAAETWATRLREGAATRQPRSALLPDRLSRRA